MKKLKYLPILGISLLTLVSCGSANNEITEAKAISLYNFTAAQQYTLVAEKCSSVNNIDAGVKELFEYGVFSNLPEFDDDFIAFANPTNCFFNEDKAQSLKAASTYFNEYITYTLDGKALTADFTGSNNNEEYGIAMNISYKYSSVGLLKYAEYTFTYALDANKDGKSESVSIYHGKVK